MGFSAQGGSVVLRTQDVAGTFNDDILTAGIGMLVKTGALQSNRDLLVADAEIGGGRDVTGAYLGSAMWNGDYEFYVRMEALKTLLGAALGTTGTPTTATGVTTTAFTPSDASQLPFLSIHEEVGAGLEVYEYTDAVVNSLNFSCDANAYMSGTAGFIARIQEAGKVAGPATTIDTSPLVVATNVTVTYNSVTLPAKAFTFDFTNNFEDSDFRLGSFFLGDLTPKRRELTCNFTIREESSALWRQATYGVSSATEVGGLTSPKPLTITASTYETISGSTPATPYELTLDMPSYILSPYSLTASGDDIIESGIDGQAMRPSKASPLITATVIGGSPTVA